MLVFWKCNKSATIRQSRLFGGCRAGWGLALALLLAACSTIDDSRDGCPEAQVSSGNPDGAIAFTATEVPAVTNASRRSAPTAAKSGLTVSCSVTPMANARVTRAEVEGETTLATMMASTDDGFGVFGSYTGMHKYSAVTVKPDFMYNDHVYYDTDNWTYSPLRYWPNGEGDVSGITGNVPHYVSFFAYAPFSHGADTDTDPLADPENKVADYCIPSFSNAHEEGDPWLLYRVASQSFVDAGKQVDLLYAQNLDETKKAAGEKVNFSFQHALACIGEQVDVAVSSDLQSLFSVFIASEMANQEHAINTIEAKVTKLQIEYTLTDKARLVLWNQGEPNWQPVLSQQMTATRTVDLITSAAPHTIYFLDLTVSSPSPVHTPWNSIDANVKKGLFAIPLESEGYAQKATVRTSYEIRINDVVDPGMSKTDVEHTIYLSDFYDQLRSGGKQLGFNITFTFPLPPTLAGLKKLCDLVGHTPFIGKHVDSDGNIEGIDDTAYSGTPAGTIVDISTLPDLADANVTGSRILIAAVDDASASATWSEASTEAASTATITGASDWYLPSNTLLATVASQLALGGDYWSSTAVDADNAYYWDGSTTQSAAKTTTKKVRAICVY